MPSIFQKTLQLLVGDDVNVDWLKLPKQRPLKQLTERELLTLESEIGATLFGPIPHGHRREFFCLDEKTWIWHEEWLDEKKKLTTSTVRYEIGEHGVLKVQEGARYSYLEGEELRNFGIAIRMYYEQVARGVYKRDPATGKSLV
jgi:hypothetical protein